LTLGRKSDKIVEAKNNWPAPLNRDRAVRLFLTKYLKLAHAFYLAVGITMMPLCAQWFSPSLNTKAFIIWTAITLVYATVMAGIIHSIVRNLFWKLFLTAIAGVSVVAVLLPIFDYSPFILAVLGILFLSGTMQLFDSIKKAFPQIDTSQIKRWLEVVLTLFTIFVSSMMVGFTIGWNNLYGEALKGTIERYIVTTGINANLIITMYYWLGAGLILLTGAKHIWLLAEPEADSSDQR
jgi:hypothetical protein